MRSIAAVMGVLVPLLAVGSEPVRAQDDGLAASVDRLGAAVDRLTVLLEKEAAARADEKEARKVQVAIGILGLRLRRIERIEAEIRDIGRDEEESRLSVEFIKSEMEGLSEAYRGENGQLTEEGKRARNEFQGRLKYNEDRLVQLAERRGVLEGELAGENRRLVGLEEILNGWLEKAAR